MDLNFPCTYKIKITTSLGVFESRPNKFENEIELGTLIHNIQMSSGSDCFKFDNQYGGATFILGEVMTNSVVELIKVS